MNPSVLRLRTSGRRAALAVVLTCLATAAHADLKLVSQVTITGSPRQAGSRTVTTCFQGDIVRTETDRAISLYDARTQTIATLDKKAQTYRMVSLKSAASPATGLLSRVHVNATASMEPQEETRMIAGRLARKYAGKATFTLSVDGMPAGAGRETVMTIEQWTSEQISTPGAADHGKTFLQLLGPLQTMPGMEPLARAMARVKGTPLSSRITVAAAGREPVVTQTEVIEVSDAPLSADLFRIPAGYHKVESTPFPAPTRLGPAVGSAGH